MSELVTGEAVVLGLRPARLPSRALAVLIDLAVSWSAYVGATVLLLSATASLDEAAVAAVSVATFVLVLVGVPIAVETLSRGRSLGKLACGLRVVREDGGPIRFRHALVRGAMGAIELVLTMGVVACIASLVSARGRRLGDVFAGTLVVRERIPAHRAAPALPPPPPWLAAELAALDLSRVPDGWWLTVRQYLARVRQLDPQVGGAMAGRLAGDLVGWTGASVPAGVSAAAYLAAVVGERQTREAQRAFGAPLGVPSVVAHGPGGGPSVAVPVPGAPYGVAGYGPMNGGAASKPVDGGVSGPMAEPVDGAASGAASGPVPAAGGTAVSRTGFAPPV
ncbi:RDD family protein [Streptomyces sp. MST-110588]|uniref:RDD family protein n=1 Tax=Streptomyces sp. MST-110588 TaxID=2833628 RepID=UPI001F5C2580|nr:RDD family protein [Streptomyces sp. MST-110588]UNO41702.1 RDD family protein [Streptomyces sp. MST-110588]